MRPRREVLLTTFADPSTFPSVLETPATPEETPAATDETAIVAAEATTADETAETAVTGDATAADEAPVRSFSDLGLPAEIVRVLTREGITTPFEIQAAT